MIYLFVIKLNLISNKNKFVKVGFGPKHGKYGVTRMPKKSKRIKNKQKGWNNL